MVAAALGCAGVAGLSVAQPAPPPAPPPAAPIAEEAPPAVVPTPAPLAVPPISEKEVEPAPPPATAAVQDKVVATPSRRARFDVAVVEAIDKVTAESVRFEAPVGKPMRFKSLVFTVKACERSAPDEAIDDSIAYLTIHSQPRPAPGKPTPPARQAFRGWMYASSPALHPLEHPVYDAWLITCRAAGPGKTPAR